jgi:hypothetical protein
MKLLPIKPALWKVKPFRPTILIVGALAVVFVQQTTPQGVFAKGAAQAFPFVEKQELYLPNIAAGYARLVADKPAVRNWEEFSLEYHYCNTGPRCGFYNPFLEIGRTLYAELAIYDGQRKYVGDLTGHPLSTSGPSSNDIVLVPTGSSVSSRFGKRIPGLDPGEYYLQLVFFRSFVGCLSGTNELFRSNPVKITVTN